MLFLISGLEHPHSYSILPFVEILERPDTISIPKKLLLGRGILELPEVLHIIQNFGGSIYGMLPHFEHPKNPILWDSNQGLSRQVGNKTTLKYALPQYRIIKKI